MTTRWTKQALTDLKNIHNYIAQDNPTAAKSMVSKIQDITNHLKKHSQIGTDGRVKGTRELFIPKSPYFLVYRVKNNYVDIIALIHSSRKWP